MPGCVDLSPGALINRECVESMLLGTPILVPRSSLAMQHAAAGGGLWFSGPAELLGAARVFGQPEVRGGLGTQARNLAATRFGDARSFVRQVGESLHDLLVGSCPNG